MKSQCDTTLHLLQLHKREKERKENRSTRQDEALMRTQSDRDEPAPPVGEDTAQPAPPVGEDTAQPAPPVGEDTVQPLWQRVSSAVSFKVQHSFTI